MIILSAAFATIRFKLLVEVIWNIRCDFLKDGIWILINVSLRNEAYAGAMLASSLAVRRIIRLMSGRRVYEGVRTR